MAGSRIMIGAALLTPMVRIDVAYCFFFPSLRVSSRKFHEHSPVSHVFEPRMYLTMPTVYLHRVVSSA